MTAKEKVMNKKCRYCYFFKECSIDNESDNIMEEWTDVCDRFFNIKEIIENPIIRKEIQQGLLDRIDKMIEDYKIILVDGNFGKSTRKGAIISPKWLLRKLREGEGK